MKRLVVLIFLIVGVHNVHAQTTLQRDTFYRQERLFDTAWMQALKATKAFKYEELQEVSPSLWQRFWKWFWWQVEKIMSSPRGKLSVWITLIVFGVAMIVFFVMKVLGMNRETLFGRNEAGQVSYSVDNDDIHSLDFDIAIHAAIAEANYRLAIRLLYLRSLKNMTDKGYINWQINKTNSDYIREVSNQQWQPQFVQLTGSFEYAWYGETPVDSNIFAELQNKFQHFNQNEL